MRLEQALEEFVLDCEIRSLSSKTIKGYRNANQGLIGMEDEEIVKESVRMSPLMNL